MINQVIISGRITRDLILETRKDKNDENIIRHHVKFSLANTNNFSNRTSYLNCWAFGKVAEIIVNNYKRGDLIFINGRLENNPWMQGDKKIYPGASIYIISTWLIQRALRNNNLSTDDSYPYNNEKNNYDNNFFSSINNNKDNFKEKSSHFNQEEEKSTDLKRLDLDKDNESENNQKEKNEYEGNINEYDDFNFEEDEGDKEDK